MSENRRGGGLTRTVDKTLHDVNSRHVKKQTIKKVSIAALKTASAEFMWVGAWDIWSLLDQYRKLQQK